MQTEPFGNIGKFIGQAFDVFGRQAAFHSFTPVFALIFCPINAVFAGVIRQACLLDVFAAIQGITISLNIRIGLFLADNTFLNQFFRIQCACARMFGHGFVHHRLGQCRIIALVVPVFAVAHHIDHNIFVECFAVVHCRLHDHANCLGVVAIHMENRRIDHFGNVCTING